MTYLQNWRKKWYVLFRIYSIYHIIVLEMLQHRNDPMSARRCGTCRPCSFISCSALHTQTHTYTHTYTHIRTHTHNINQQKPRKQWKSACAHVRSEIVQWTMRPARICTYVCVCRSVAHAAQNYGAPDEAQSRCDTVRNLTVTDTGPSGRQLEPANRFCKQTRMRDSHTAHIYMCVCAPRGDQNCIQSVVVFVCICLHGRVWVCAQWYPHNIGDDAGSLIAVIVRAAHTRTRTIRSTCLIVNQTQTNTHLAV